MLKEEFDKILTVVHETCLNHYGDKLVSLAVFGSVARGAMKSDSDIDLLVVVESLPRGRLARVRDFEQVEIAVADRLREAEQHGIHTTLAPVFKTREEVEYGSPLFLDMTDQAKMLFDRDDFLRNYLKRLAIRLKQLGAKRIYRGGGYYWLLKPDLKPGEEIQL